MSIQSDEHCKGKQLHICCSTVAVVGRCFEQAHLEEENISHTQIEPLLLDLGHNSNSLLLMFDKQRTPFHSPTNKLYCLLFQRIA